MNDPHVKITRAQVSAISELLRGFDPVEETVELSHVNGSATVAVERFGYQPVLVNPRGEAHQLRREA